MNLQEKIEYVKKNKPTAVAALNKVLDRIYDIKDKFFDDEENLKEGLERDEKAEKELHSLFRDAEKYEEVRQKLLDDDFNLSLAEINYIGLSYFYLIANWENMIKRLRKAITEAEDGYKKLTEKETS